MIWGKTVRLTETLSLTEAPLEDGQGFEVRVSRAGEVLGSGRCRVDAARRYGAIDVSAADAGVDRLLAYAAVRRCRILGASCVATHDGKLAELLAMETVPGGHAQRVDLAAHVLATNVLPDVYVTEIRETVERWLETVPETGFFAAVNDKSLTRPQYVYTLSNMHQFVRWTTRLLGMAVSVCRSTELRNHFLHHLQGEVNHETIIEKDLAALGANVDFVTDYMSPNAATRAFMANQESLICWHRDPVLFAASPLAAEGIAAHMAPELLHRLEQVVASWGIERPSGTVRFFASHTHFDGGQDGHWAGTLEMLRGHIGNETRLQAFLANLHASMDALSALYNNVLRETEVFQTGPQPTR